MSRVYNFSAGPAVLPVEVLKEAQEEMLDYRGCGMSDRKSTRLYLYSGLLRSSD